MAFSVKSDLSRQRVRFPPLRSKCPFYATTCFMGRVSNNEKICRIGQILKLKKRETGFEPATPCLEGRNSSAELLPRESCHFSLHSPRMSKPVRTGGNTLKALLLIRKES